MAPTTHPIPRIKKPFWASAPKASASLLGVLFLGVFLLGSLLGSAACSGGSSPGGRADGGRPSDGTTYHPAGFRAASAHGLELKMQVQDCRNCHGADLSGGTSQVSCDTCHTAGWRTNCTFCHGGDTPGGAPPRDINGTTDLASVRFAGHTAHISNQRHKAFDCTQCHKKPVDVLSVGHIFDDTPGRAEVDLSAGLSSGGQYSEATGCSNLYCHGTGLQPGTSKRDDPPKTCSSCHASISTPAAWSSMSGAHRLHLRTGLLCGDCHSGTVSGANTIIANAPHVDGVADKTMAGTGITLRGNGRCNGSCHGKFHFLKGW